MTEYDIELEARARNLDESTSISWLWAGLFGVVYFLFHGLYKYMFCFVGYATFTTVVLLMYQFEVYGEIPTVWLTSDWVHMAFLMFVSAIMAKPAWKERAIKRAKEEIIYEAMKNLNDVQK